jgi:hypothetical protein
MNDFDTKWRRLTALARQAPDGDDGAAPHGFATRVAARAFEPRPGPLALFERFALRGLLAAFALSLASAAYSYTALMAHGDEEITLAADPLPELLELS